MLDETIILETPPLYSCYGRVGQQVEVPVTGNHARRVLHGVLNVESGAVLLLITNEWDQDTHQAFLRMIRAHWRGWRIVLFEDRGSPHTATDTQECAEEFGRGRRQPADFQPQLLCALLGIGRGMRRAASSIDWRERFARAGPFTCRHRWSMAS